MEIGKLPASHLESVITLLPKEGKDTKEIKNWRPITLSNCDSKIITKALALRAAKVLKSIVDPSQTAYIPGRSVMDNLRSNYFLKTKCRKKNINAVLISLDAKKVFDSVDHEYIEKTLEKYGFGKTFRKSFKVLYKDITARVMVNGFLSDPIKIERGVKQGDALSCAIFILCIDPLLRNLNSNHKIRAVPNNNIYKAAAYADDISVICMNEENSIQEVFKEYGKLTTRSGLELNADKTEILILNDKGRKNIKFCYDESDFEITTVEKIKICGLVFANDPKEEHRQNVLNKIKRLEHNLKLWSHRHLTMEGKSLIVKTFGLSQLIYNMQSYKFEKNDLLLIERMIFKFLWSTSEQQNGIDRIRRSIMKNIYSKGGMKITDVECLDRALKLKQYFRAKNSDHIIEKIQANIMKDNPSQEYSYITTEEAICESAQVTINIITDFNRNTYSTSIQNEDQEFTDKFMINEVSSINLKTYLTRKGRTLLLCLLNTLTKLEIHTLADLVQSYEFEQNLNTLKIMESVLNIFPVQLKKIAKCYNENINSDNQQLEYIQLDNNVRKEYSAITVSELQMTLKRALKRIEILDVSGKNNITQFQEDNIELFRRFCKNAKLRNIYFRLIHNDFFTHRKMKQYNMTESDKCPRCYNIETTKHLLWECEHSRKIWDLYNVILAKTNNINDKVMSFDDVFKTGLKESTCLIKIKVIQELIQKERPKNWPTERLTNMVKNLIAIETLTNVKKKKYNIWLEFENL